ncbi:hypothetical protein O9G_004727 [Rozella allomycis CSF55]|uniref:Zinc finger PHD-type domain-containing protein n=1 Tax=Rozella allomycis (strain CSF55) TaxID=988480 RepID=A0A075APB2_ROZAC|nr:hypothetical protein O9G_004727 [Rozella allomycis CSF55]|eukprot:EPZ31904.1 hypothetical protein O9G_004727 [Rozella allomycis CSF55]
MTKAQMYPTEPASDQNSNNMDFSPPQLSSTDVWSTLVEFSNSKQTMEGPMVLNNEYSSLNSKNEFFELNSTTLQRKDWETYSGNSSFEQMQELVRAVDISLSQSSASHDCLLNNVKTYSMMKESDIRPEKFYSKHIPDGNVSESSSHGDSMVLRKKNVSFKAMFGDVKSNFEYQDDNISRVSLKSERSDAPNDKKKRKMVTLKLRHQKEKSLIVSLSKPKIIASVSYGTDVESIELESEQLDDSLSQTRKGEYSELLNTIRNFEPDKDVLQAASDILDISVVSEPIANQESSSQPMPDKEETKTKSIVSPKESSFSSRVLRKRRSSVQLDRARKEDEELPAFKIEEYQKLFNFDKETIQKQHAKIYNSKKGESAGEKILNRDVCNTCKDPGTFICCEACPRSFHFECTDPPLEFRKNTPRVREGLFQSLMKKILRTNPEDYILPIDIREYFENVSMDASSGQYIDTREAKPSKTRILHNEYDYKKLLIAENGKILLCHCCDKSSLWGAMVPCDFCPLAFHLDCLNPPLIALPASNRKWMCPNHIDNYIKPTRKPKISLKNVKPVQKDSNATSDFEIDTEKVSNKRYKLSESYLTTNFVRKVHEKTTSDDICLVKVPESVSTSFTPDPTSLPKEDIVTWLSAVIDFQKQAEEYLQNLQQNDSQ